MWHIVPLSWPVSDRQAVTCGIIIITFAAKFALRFISASPVNRTETCDEPCQLQQIPDAEQGTPLADDNLRIRRNKICPLSGNRADDVVIHLQQDSRSVPVVPLTDTDELSSSERMERMRYPNKLCPSNGRVCILS